MAAGCAKLCEFKDTRGFPVGPAAEGAGKKNGWGLPWWGADTRMSLVGAVSTHLCHASQPSDGGKELSPQADVTPARGGGP